MAIDWKDQEDHIVWGMFVFLGLLPKMLKCKP